MVPRVIGEVTAKQRTPAATAESMPRWVSSIATHAEATEQEQRVAPHPAERPGRETEAAGDAEYQAQLAHGATDRAAHDHRAEIIAAQRMHGRIDRHEDLWQVGTD